MFTRPLDRRIQLVRQVYLRFAPYLFSFLFIPFCFKQFSHVNLHKGKTTNFTMVHKRDAVIETYFSTYQKQFLTMFDSNSNIMQINGRLPTYFNGRCQSDSAQTVCDSILANDFLCNFSRHFSTDCLSNRMQDKVTSKRVTLLTHYSILVQSVAHRFYVAFYHIHHNQQICKQT